MIAVQLSEQVKQICEEHYDFKDKKKPGCGKCPIQSACITNMTIRTMDQLEGYRLNINRLAAEVMAAKDDSAGEKDEGQADLFDYVS